MTIIEQDNKFIINGTYHIGKGNGIETEQDAINAYNTAMNTSESVLIERAKSAMISQIKHDCANLLSQTDYKVVRHRDQLDGNQTTTLTDAEYKTLLADREAMRAKSNLFESEVMALTTLNGITNYT